MGLWDCGIVGRVRVFGDVQIFLYEATRVGEKRPMSTDPTAIFIRLNDAVGADRDEAAIGNRKLPMELNKPLGLPAVLGAVTAAAENEHHRVLSLQIGKLAALSCVVGQLVIGKDRPWNDVGSHLRFLKDWKRRDPR
jgi:hypothetical protein